MKAHLVMDREQAAIVHAVCEAYAADDDVRLSPFADVLDDAIEQLRGTITSEETQAARILLQQHWERVSPGWSLASAD